MLPDFVAKFFYGIRTIRYVMIPIQIQKLMDEAKIAYSSFEFAKAFNAYEMALKELNKEAGQRMDRRVWAQIYKGMIDSLDMDGDWLKALEYAGILITEAKMKNEIKIEIETRLMTCKILLNHGSWEEARKRFDSTLKLAEQSGADMDIGQCIYGIAYIDWRKGDMQGAMFKTEKALSYIRGHGQKILEAKTIILKASIEDAMGNPEEAIKLFKEAIETLTGLEENEELARAYNNLGEVYKGIEDYTSASEQYEACVKVSRKVKSKRSELYGLSNAAECYAYIGRPDDARKMLTQVEKILKKTHERYIMAQIHYILGVIANVEKDYRSAVKEYEIAIDKMIKMGEPPYDMGLVFFRYGEALKALEDETEARQAFDRAESYFKKIDSKLYLKKLRDLRD